MSTNSTCSFLPMDQMGINVAMIHKEEEPLVVEIVARGLEKAPLVSNRIQKLTKDLRGRNLRGE